jgi:hypothetical protein
LEDNRQKKPEAGQPQSEDQDAQDAPQRNIGRDPTAGALGEEQRDPHAQE